MFQQYRSLLPYESLLRSGTDRLRTLKLGLQNTQQSRIGRPKIHLRLQAHQQGHPES